MICHNTIDLVHLFTGFIKITILEMRTLPLGTLGMISADREPGSIFNLGRPGIPVSVPTALTQSGEHRLVKLLMRLLCWIFLIVIKRKRMVHRAHFLKCLIESGQTQIASAPLGQGITKIELGVLSDIG